MDLWIAMPILDSLILFSGVVTAGAGGETNANTLETGWGAPA